MKKDHILSRINLLIAFKFVSKLYSYPVIICSKLTTKTLEQGRKYAQINVVVIVNFEHISHLVLVFLLLTLSR